MSSFSQKVVFIVSFGALMSTCVAASAQDNQESEIEEIIVTATKRVSTIKDVPFSINAQTQQDIERWRNQS